MKKYVLLFSIVLVTISILLLFGNDEKVIFTNNNSGQLINTNALTMMYETEAGSGEYQVSSSNVWPQMDIFLMQNCLVVKTEVHLLGMMKIRESCCRLTYQISDILRFVKSKFLWYYIHAKKTQNLTFF